MTKEVAEKIVRGIEDKIECNTVDIDDWAEFWGFTREEYEDFLDMVIKALEKQPCEDCISRAEALKHSFPIYDDDGVGYIVIRADKIEQLPSVTPSIPDVENNFNLGYNCGYADAMSDIAESEG